MINVLYLVPTFAIISAVLMYRLNGKKEFLKIDLVQFFYAFVLTPMLFVWLKTFLYFLLRVEVNIQLSTIQLFLLDTAFSLFFMYVFAFVVIHSLTKTFFLKRVRDPLYDVFAHSEFFHLWLTHLIMYIGGMVLISGLSIFNLWFPLEFDMSQINFYLINVFGLIAGFGVFMIIWLSDPKQDSANFMRLMKLSFGFFFLIHVVVYFVINPPFSAAYGLYWGSLNIFTALVLCSLFAYRSERAQSFFEKVSDYLKHHGWGKNVQLFKKKK